MRKSLITVNYHKCYTAVLEKVKITQLVREIPAVFMLSSTLHLHLQSGLLHVAIPVA